MTSKKHHKEAVAVLITGAGGAGTIEIIKSLKALNRYRIVAADADAFAAGFAFADTGYTIEMATDSHFKETIREVLRVEKPHFVVPLVDEEILLCHDILSEKTFKGIQIITPTRKFCRDTLDKWQTHCDLEELELPTPPTCLASEAEKATFPAVIKPRDGRGSRGVSHLYHQEDLKHYLTNAGRPADDYIVQKRIDGVEYTVSVVVGLDGTLLAVVPKEVVVKKGITQVGITRHCPSIEKLCRDIQERLRADGPFNVQLFLDREGTPYVIEINPRFSTTVALTIASGINEVHAVICHALGERLPELSFKADLMMLRYPTQLYIQEDDWHTSRKDGAASRNS